MIELGGWLGMSENEFWECTPRYFVARIQGKQRDERERWTIARQIAYWSILPHMGKKQIKPTALALFAWERSKVKFKEITPDQKADIDKFKQMALTMLNAN